MGRCLCQKCYFFLLYNTSMLMYKLVTYYIQYHASIAISSTYYIYHAYYIIISCTYYNYISCILCISCAYYIYHVHTIKKNYISCILYISCTYYIYHVHTIIISCPYKAASRDYVHCKNDGGYFPPKLCPTIGGRSHHSNCGGLLTPNSVHHRWEIPPE